MPGIPIQRSLSNFIGYFTYGAEGYFASFYYGNSDDYLIYYLTIEVDNERTVEDIPIILVNYREPATFKKSDHWQLEPIYVVNMKFIDSVKIFYRGGMNKVDDFYFSMILFNINDL